MTPVMNPVSLKTVLTGHVEVCANAYVPVKIPDSPEWNSDEKYQRESGMAFFEHVPDDWETCPAIGRRAGRGRCYAYQRLIWLEKNGLVERKGASSKTKWKRK